MDKHGVLFVVCLWVSEWVILEFGHVDNRGDGLVERIRGGTEEGT